MDSLSIVSVAKIDVRDPMRYKTNKFEGALVKFFHENEDEESVYIMAFSKNGDFSASFDLHSYKDWPLYDGYGRIVSMGIKYCTVALRLDRNELISEEIKEFKKIFLDLARSINAFYGRVSDFSMCVHHNMLLEAAEDVNDTLGINRKGVNFECGIRDIYWLNYFGPGYKEFWGKEKIEKLLKGYSDVIIFKDGAFCVQTMPNPVKADLSIKRTIDYPWKKHFYEVLGYNTFVHETQIRGEKGQYVPILDVHRKYNRDAVR
jgi:hypothetical protein